MLDFAAKATLNAASCTEDDVDGLRSHGFTDQEILEIVMAVCWYSIQTRVADALGVQLDDGIQRNKGLLEAFSFR